jgi:hypothetical protein
MSHWNEILRIGNRAVGSEVRPLDRGSPDELKKNKACGSAGTAQQSRILALIRKTPQFDRTPACADDPVLPASRGALNALKRQETLEAFLGYVLTLEVRGFPANLP